MKHIFKTVAVALAFLSNPVMADADHEIDAQKVEIDVVRTAPIADAKGWTALTVQISNPFTVPIILRDIRVKKGDAKLEKLTKFFGNKVWTEHNLLRLSAGEAFVTDNTTYRLSTNVPLVPGSTVQFDFDFGPYGPKTFFYRVAG